MSIKNLLVRLAEKITDRKCCRCQYSRSGTCAHPKEDTFSRCWQSLDRPGFLQRVKKAPGDLTPEEEHQLGKIVESLQEASETARDGGLLGVVETVPANLDDKTESGLLEEE